MDIALHSIFILGMLIFCMLFKISEVAISTASELGISMLDVDENKQAKRVLKLISGTGRSTSPYKVAISCFEFLTTGAVLYLSTYPADYCILHGMDEILAKTLFAILFLLVYVVFTVVLVAIVARHIALKDPTKTALAFSGFALVVHKFFTPLSAVISVISKGILALMKINPEKQDGQTATEEAIKMLVDTGSEHGMIDDEEKEFIENVFNFDDVDANEIATHRKEITLLWTDETDEEWEKTISQSHHSYFPICDEKIDNVIGVVSAKDYFRIKSKTRQNVMKNSVRPPFYIRSCG